MAQVGNKHKAKSEADPKPSPGALADFHSLPGHDILIFNRPE